MEDPLARESARIVSLRRDATTRRAAIVVAACALLIAAAAACDAGMDALSFRYDQSVAATWHLDARWFDPRLSWRNKWLHGDPTAGEAFPLSSTALVAFTDAWHALKACGLACAAAALLAPWSLVVRMRPIAWLGVFVAIAALRGVVFEALFGHLLVAHAVAGR